MAKAGQIEDFFRSQGLSQEQSEGILAGIYAETGFREDILYGQQSTRHHPLGIGQWLGDRKRRLIAMYGEHPSLNQQLWFLWEELNGYDYGGHYVLHARNKYDTMYAYIAYFMRPGRSTHKEIRRASYWLASYHKSP